MLWFVGKVNVWYADKALLYLPLNHQCNEEELFQLSSVKNNPLITFHEMWMSPLLHRFSIDESKRELKIQLSGRWQTALISGLRDQPLQELEEQLTAKLRRILFYHPEPEDLTSLKYEDIKKEPGAPTQNKRRIICWSKHRI